MVQTDPSSKSLIDRIAVSGTVAAAFTTDTAGRVLLVKPASRDEWGFVGGWVDRGEAPHQGCAREIEEEIGLVLPVGDLLVLDWLTETGYVAEPLTFYLFDGGVIDDLELIRPRAGEIEEFGFFPPEQALARSGEVRRVQQGEARVGVGGAANGQNGVSAVSPVSVRLPRAFLLSEAHQRIFEASSRRGPTLASRTDGSRFRRQR